VTFAVLTACGVSDSLGPVATVEATNSVDQFQLQVLAMEDGTGTRTYAWENTGTQATVDIVQNISSGSAILTIQDASGTVVHQEDIANDNDTDTSVGIAGSWTIEVRMEKATGWFNIAVAKKT